MFKQFALLATLLTAILLAGCNDDYGLDQHGQKVGAAALDKQWLVINYWAQWCGPCRTEIPEMNKLSEQLKGQGDHVIGVNFDNLKGDNLKQASEALGIRFTVLADDPAPRFDLPASEALPVTYIIDPQGKVREQLAGEQTAAGVAARLAELKKS